MDDRESPAQSPDPAEITSSDDELLHELRRIAAEVDPVPDLVFEAARAAITMGDLDGELAVLVGDSAADAGEPALRGLAYDLVRSGTSGGGRLLSFVGGGVQVDLEVTGGADHLTLFGQLAGAAADGCVLERGNGARRGVEVDELGRFLLTDALPGPVRLRCRSVSGTPVTTTWTTI
jgi:hypothetical protein